MNYLEQKINELREHIKGVNSDVYSASHEIGDDNELVDTMIGVLIDRLINDEYEYTMRDLEYDARSIIDPTDEF